jgi:hypothetical protein
MKNKIAIFVGLLFLMSSALCFAEVNLENWRFYKEISGTGEGLARFSLDDEIFSGTQKNLSDLRVVSGAGQEVPFKIVSGRENQRSITHSLKVINSSYVPEKHSSAIFDFGESGKIINTLTLETTTENFQRNVKLFGGDSLENWNVISDGKYIYDYTDKKGSLKAQNVTLDFPDSAWRYYRVEISDENNYPVKISGARASQVVLGESREASRKVSYESREDREKKITELEIDLGVSGIPTSKILLETQDVNFNRPVVILTSSDKNEWQPIGQDYVFRYSTPKFSGEKKTVVFPETNRRHLKLQIMNYDNASLSFSALTVFSVYREVVFQTKQNESYRVFYGNDEARSPQYDLEKFFQYLEVQDSRNATLSSQKDNPAFVPKVAPEKPLSERLPYLLPVALSLLSLFMIFLVYNFLKK